MKTILTFIYCALLALTLSTQASENTDEKENTSEATKNEAPKAISTGDKIYTWIDKNGNKIYSDVPKDGAKVMEIPHGTNYTPPDTTEPDWSTMKPKVVPTNESYSNFEIASPSNESTVRNNAGNIQVALDIRPQLAKGHKVKLEVDGNEVTGKGSFFTLTNIDRGSHTLIAYIFTTNGEIVATTSPVIVHMHRAIKRTKSN